MLNTQPISKADHNPDGSLYVHSVFPTIQGEGPLVGIPSIFVRLNGCNLQCPMCDTDYTSKGELLEAGALIDRVKATAGQLKIKQVVITGGEPFRQNIVPFVRGLLDAGFRVQIETNGTLFLEFLPFNQILIICSPKTGKVNPELARHIHSYKYVIHADSVDPEDGLPTLALGHTAAPRVARPPDNFSKNGTHLNIYLQPADSRDPAENFRHLQAAVASCMRHGYRLCIQTHKIIGME